ncbi:Regulator of G-protein signaling 3 [Frankliniella fusca]|uniref:Regulator of G-protein signaling 3 n=1 Tax=Frankliniella fusca TaxID=407009 RepID=A0AAE1LS49_9NEOP|nr:Regulator of G-protein signaling 3 [Frankliniella fusca]
MLKWTVCQQRQGQQLGSARTPGPGPGPGSASSTSPMTSSRMSSLARRSCGAAIGLLQDADVQAGARAARRAARRSARRCKDPDGGADGDKENATSLGYLLDIRRLSRECLMNVFWMYPDCLLSVPVVPLLDLTDGRCCAQDEQPFSPRAREAYGALRDVSNTPTAAGEGRLSLKTPDSGKKRSRSQCRDITNIPAAADQPRSRSSGSGRPSLSLSATPESKRPRPRIQPYEDGDDDVVEASWPAQLEAQVATLKFLPRQRTASSGVARIRQSRDLARGVAAKAPRIASAPKRHHRRRKSASATPRFVRPAVETAADAARCAVVVPLKDHVTPSGSPRTGRSARTSPEHPEASASAVSPGETLLRMLERVAAEEQEAAAAAPASRTASPVAIDYSPCPLRTTQSLLALRRRLFDTSVLEPNARTGRLQHTDHQDADDGDATAASPAAPGVPGVALPLTTPLIAAFDRWHRLRDSAAGTPLPAGAGRARRPSVATPSGVSPLACRLAWLRLQAQRDAADPTQCPFPPFGHDGRYLSVDAPEPPTHHASSPQLNASLLSARRRRLSGSMPSVASSSFRVPSTPKRDAKRSRCSPASLLASDTLSLLNHGPASSASLTSLCSLFPGYRPPSVASASSLSDLPTMSSSPLAEAGDDASLLRRQRCVRRRRRTSLTDLEAVLTSTLSAAASCPNIPREADDACPSPLGGLSSSGYSSSTTEPLCRPLTSCSASTASSHNLDAPSTASSVRSRRYGLTLPTGIPSPESPLDAASCHRAEATTLLDPNFMSSTPLLPRAAPRSTLADKLSQSRASHAPDRADQAEETDFDSASLLVNRGSPATDDTWESHRVQKVVRTPSAAVSSCDSDPLNEDTNDCVPPSPLALVERRCRSRKGLLFASPGANSAVPLDLDLDFPGGLACSSLLTPSSGSSTSSSYASSSSSCRSRRKSTPWRRSCKDVALPGELELNIYAAGDQLTVHVVRGSGLRRPGGDSCNAYVKVSLVAGATEEKTFRRTCVHRDSSQPFFDHKFSFEVREADLEKRVLVSVWHRDRPKR